MKKLNFSTDQGKANRDGLSKSDLPSMPVLGNAARPRRVVPVSSTPVEDAPSQGSASGIGSDLKSSAEAVVIPLAQPGGSSLPEMRITVDRLSVWKGNPRHVIIQSKLDELIESLRLHQQQNPIDVIRDENNPGHFLIIAGQRRWLAIKAGELFEGQAWIRIRDDLTTLEAIYAAAIETQTTTDDLQEIDFAISLACADNDIGVRALARVIGKDPSSVSRLKQIGGLPEPILSYMKTHPQKFSLAFGYEVVLALKEFDAEKALHFAREIVEKDLTVKRAAIVRSQLNPSSSEPEPKKTKWANVPIEGEALPFKGIMKSNSSKGQLVLTLENLTEDRLLSVRTAIERVLYEQGSK